MQTALGGMLDRTLLGDFIRCALIVKVYDFRQGRSSFWAPEDSQRHSKKPADGATTCLLR